MALRNIVKIDEEKCTGCGLCVNACAEGAIKIIDGKARLVSEIYCDGLGACLGECPTGALKIIEREAEDFDENAVEERLKELEKGDSGEDKVLCPSGMPQILSPGISCRNANEPVSQASAVSALSHWPVQIRLVPPDAPFLKEADLLVVADCAALSYAGMHRDFIAGKAVMMGCPKFDNVQEYIQKFTDIFNTADIKSITVPVMEVPCCEGLPVIVQKALERAGKQIPLRKVVISRQGEVLSSEDIS